MLSKNLFYMVGGQITGIILGFVANVLIARSLGPTGKGYLDLVLGSANLLVTFLGFSLGSGVFYYASREELQYRRLYGLLTLISLLQALIVLVGLFLLKNSPVAEWLLPPDGREIAIGLVAVVFLLQQMNRFAQVLLNGKQRFQSVSIRNVGTQILSVILLAILFIANIESPYYFVGSSIVVVFVTIVLSLWELWKIPIMGDRILLKAAFVYSLPLALGNFIQFLNYRMDIFIVKYYHGLYSLGVYTLAVGIGQLLWLVPNNLAQLVLNKAAADKSGQWNLEQVALLNRLSLWLGLLLALGMMVAAPTLLVPIYGARFQDSIQPLLYLLPGIVCFTVTIVLSGQLAGVGKQSYTTIVAAASFICTLLLDFLLIPTFGATGAAIASSCAYMLSAVLTWYFFRRVYPDVRLKDLLLLRKADIAQVWGRCRQIMKQVGVHA